MNIIIWYFKANRDQYIILNHIYVVRARSAASSAARATSSGSGWTGGITRVQSSVVLRRFISLLFWGAKHVRNKPENKSTKYNLFAFPNIYFYWWVETKCWDCWENAVFSDRVRKWINVGIEVSNDIYVDTKIIYNCHKSKRHPAEWYRRHAVAAETEEEARTPNVSFSPFVFLCACAVNIPWTC